MLFSGRDQVKLYFFLFLQISLAALDVVGILLFASIAAISAVAIQGNVPSGVMSVLINSLGLENESPQFTVAVITTLASVLLICRSILSLILTKKSLNFLVSREAMVSAGLSAKILSQDLDALENTAAVDYQNSITLGSGAVTTSFVSQVSSLISEICLQAALLFVVFFLSPIITFSLIGYFLVIFLLTTNRFGNKSKFMSQEITNFNQETSRALFDAVANYRLVITTSSQGQFVNRIQEARRKIAKHAVSQQMLSTWSKYLFEMAFLLGSVSFATYCFVMYSAVKAASLITIFLATCYRLVPSFARVQGLIVQIKGSIGSAQLFFEVFDKINRELNLSQHKLSPNLPKYTIDSTNYHSSSFIEFRNVSFAYHGSKSKVFEELDLKIDMGEKCGLLGPSGSGKSTFVDLLIGALTPSSGEVLIKGNSVHYGIKNGLKIGYAPQNVHLLPSTIKENIGFGISAEQLNLDRIRNVLCAVGLEEWVMSLPKNIDSNLGEFSSRISGGQAQRLGIARALYAFPDILILDEPTSSLDAESEFKISEIIQKLDTELTLITIAHRLSTVQNLPRLFYLEAGKVIAEGNFNELRKKIVSLDRSANLLGIIELE